jgi:hypothetical protein
MAVARCPATDDRRQAHLVRAIALEYRELGKLAADAAWTDRAPSAAGIP